jgi:hypothetical protein
VLGGADVAVGEVVAGDDAVGHWGQRESGWALDGNGDDSHAGACPGGANVLALVRKIYYYFLHEYREQTAPIN